MDGTLKKLLVALAVAAAMLAGCAHGGKRAGDKCGGWRTQLGICVENIPMSIETRNMIDNAFAEAQDCWEHIVDGNGLKVVYEASRTRAEARWGTVFAYPDISYATMRHELSHVVSGRKTGDMQRDYSGKCWL